MSKSSLGCGRVNDTFSGGVNLRTPAGTGFGQNVFSSAGRFNGAPLQAAIVVRQQRTCAHAKTATGRKQHHCPQRCRRQDREENERRNREQNERNADCCNRRSDNRSQGRSQSQRFLNPAASESGTMAAQGRRMLRHPPSALASAARHRLRGPHIPSSRAGRFNRMPLPVATIVRQQRAQAHRQQQEEARAECSIHDLWRHRR
jgi:hypothetical protein